MCAEQVFNINCELLRAHAGTVNELASALAAARPTTATDPQAYGSLCQFLPSALGDTCDHGAQALGAATAALNDTASTVHATADSFENADTAGTPAND